MDKFLRIVYARYPEEFEQKVNELLTQGCWRVAETSIDPGRHYWAMLIQSSPKEKKNCLVENKDEISKN